MSAVVVLRKADHFKPAIAAFCEAWEATYGEPYLPSPAECRQLRALICRTPISVVAQLPEIFARYLQDLDPFVAETMGHSLLWFCSARGNGINKYRVRRSVLSVKEARGVAAGRQFVNGEGNHADKR